MKNKIFLFVYYCLLLLVMVSWTNVDNAPNAVYRIAYVAAIFLPLYWNIELLPMVVIAFYSISSYGFAYSYLPTDLYIYTFIVFFWVVLFKTKQKNRKFEGTRLYLTLFALILIVDFVYGFEYGFRIQNITFSILICIMFNQLIGLNNKKNIHYLSFSFLVISFVLSVLFILYGQNFSKDYNTMEGTMERIGWTDPNYFGCVVGMGIVVAVNHLLKVKMSNIYKIFLIATILLSLITLALNASRGAMLAVVVSTIIMVSITKIKWYNKIIIAFLLTGILAYLYMNQYLDLLIYRFQEDEGTGGGRSEIWLTKLKAFYNDGNPLQWLFGYGFNGGFNLGFSKPTGFHNDFIAFLVDYGIVGLTLFIAALILPVVKATSRSRPTLLAFVLYLAICCMTLEPLTAGRFTYFGFYFYILLVAKYNSENNQILNDIIINIIKR